QSAMWSAAMRILEQLRAGKEVHIIHLGDHDPSGNDMSRDIRERIHMFLSHHREGSSKFELNRIALNMDQVKRYSLPPNPAKVTDSRSARYIKQYGDESWELDALEPRVLTVLIHDAVSKLRDQALWDASVRVENKAKKRLRTAAESL